MESRDHGNAWDTAACDLMRRQKQWERAILCGVDIVGSIFQQKLSNTYKVHHLGNAKEWSNDQGTARGPLKERSRTFLCHDLPTMEERMQGQYTISAGRDEGKSKLDDCMSNLPDTVYDSIVGFFIGSFFE